MSPGCDIRTTTMTNYKPSDLFIGVFEFFGILLPAAAFMFLLDSPIALAFEKVVPRLHNDLERWIGFLFAAYIAGHFLHSLGFLLDEFIYDPFYKPLKLAKKKGEDIRVESKDSRKNALTFAEEKTQVSGNGAATSSCSTRGMVSRNGQLNRTADYLS